MMKFDRLGNTVLVGSWIQILDLPSFLIGKLV